jgi:LysM repeat protein
MKRENSTIARILAALALIGTVVVVIVVVSSQTGGSEDKDARGGNRAGQNANNGQGNQNGRPGKPVKKVYVVKEGDTLTGIAVSNGVSVAAIERLNPDLDPQALIPGQKLKLR